jgi:hypothetical protein
MLCVNANCPICFGIVWVCENHPVRPSDDCEITNCGSDLDTFVRQGRHAADELPRPLEVLGIVEAALMRSEPAVLRDMERVCVSCERKA